MKLLAQIIIACSLAIALAGASTAYMPAVADLALDAGTEPRTLVAEAGRRGADEAGAEASAPIAAPGSILEPTRLTPELLEALAANETERVRVAEFSFWLWPGKWLFLGGVLGILAGTVMLRLVARQDRVAQQADIDLRSAEASRRALGQVQQRVERLRTTLPDLLQDRQRIAAILEAVEELDRDQIPAFLQTRSLLRQPLGLAGEARLMHCFGAAERMLHRAWAAAAEGLLDEATEPLDLAADLLVLVEGQLPAQERVATSRALDEALARVETAHAQAGAAAEEPDSGLDAEEIARIEQEVDEDLARAAPESEPDAEADEKADEDIDLGELDDLDDLTEVEDLHVVDEFEMIEDPDDTEDLLDEDQDIDTDDEGGKREA